jgi:hypothetical protein
VSTKHGQMAIPGIIGPMSGMATVTGRAPRPLATIPAPSAVYWPAQPAGTIRTASQTPALPDSPAPSPTPNGGACCGQ